jgi:hypothetical protein
MVLLRQNAICDGLNQRNKFRRSINRFTGAVEENGSFGSWREDAIAMVKESVGTECGALRIACRVKPVIGHQQIA